MSKRIHYGIDNDFFYFFPTINFDNIFKRLNFQWLTFYVTISLWRKKYV